jgi:hypothetical protein
VSFRSKRRAAIWGGLLAGLGLGAAAAWALNVFEIANPQIYPTAGATVLALLVFCGAFGVGLGLVASALIRNEDTQDLADAGSSQTTPRPERRILGLRIDS